MDGLWTEPVADGACGSFASRDRQRPRFAGGFLFTVVRTITGTTSEIGNDTLTIVLFDARDFRNRANLVNDEVSGNFQDVYISIRLGV